MNTDLAHASIHAAAILGGKTFINAPERAGLLTSANISIATLVSVSQERRNASIHGVAGNSAGTTLVCLTNIDDHNYFLKRPVVLTMRREGPEYIIAFPEAELSRSGPTIEEAVNWLRSSMISLYDLYKGESRLGPLPQRQLQALGKYIGEKKAKSHRPR